MVKTVLGVNHRGLTDWLFQRVTAIGMVIYSLILLFFFIGHPNLNFYDWHLLFSHLGMKVMTWVVVVGLLYHAWIGMWTVLTDYVKNFVLRLFLELVVLISLIAFFFLSVFILWSV